MLSILNENYKNIEDAFNEFPILESKRFYFKEIKEENFNDIYKIFSDDDVMRFSGINVVEPFRQVKNYLKRVSVMYREKQGIRWSIYDKLNNDFVGDIGLFNIDKKEKAIEIGYLIAKNHWNKGIGEECSREIIKFAFNNLAIEKITAVIDAENIPSIKLIEKIGFKMEYEFAQLAFNRFRRHYYMFSLKNKLNNC